ncbi:DUF5696 domain-containing protein [Cohnella sp.]|uniref:DUF5696 domain-containing protein n=1 Tax=Cohnella sp. TaxID=1883426 RepID=UPI00356223A4
MKKSVIFIGVAVILLGSVATVIWGFQPQKTAIPVTAANEIMLGKGASYSKPQADLDGMTGIVTNGKLSLYMDEATTGIAVRNERTGYVWYSNPPGLEEDSQATPANKHAMRSPIAISYINTGKQPTKFTASADSVAHGNFSSEIIDGGLRVAYHLGKPTAKVDRIPQKISQERLDRIKEKAGQAYRRYFINTFMLDPETNVYARIDTTLNGTVLNKVLDAFELSGYTEEDLAKDNSDNHVDVPPVDADRFTVAIEYVLDGESLVVRVPGDQLEYSETTPLLQVSVLEYFGAGGPEDEGYLFVPDGSGSLIYMNRPKSGAVPYSQPVYGEDLAVKEKRSYTVKEKIRMPVFGIRKNNEAALAIIESGEAVARIRAASSGILSSFNNVYSEFKVLSQENVRVESGAKFREIPVYQDERTASDFVVRYKFLSGDQADYSGMAAEYRRYLVEQGNLAKKNADEPRPFYLDLIGAIPTKKHFLGIPYETMRPLTTFEQAQTILEQLIEGGVTPIKLRYSGWFNGGIEHALPSKVSPEKSLGGMKGLEKLNRYAEDHGITLYPDVSLLRLYAQSSFTYSPAKAAVRNLNRTPSAVHPYNPALGMRDRTEQAYHLLAPQVVPAVVDRFLAEYGKLPISGLSLADLGDILYGDYRKGSQVDRTQTERVVADQARKIKNAMTDTELMVDGGHAYLFAYADDIVNAPMSDSGCNITDEDVPFYQMVLHGYIDYAGAPYNLVQTTDLRDYVLKNIEYGSNLHFAWIFGDNILVKETDYNGLFSVHYKTWLHEAVAAYHEANAALKPVANLAMTKHEVVIHGVRKSEYEDGTTIIVNYNDYDVQVDGITVQARGYYAGGERA